MKINKLAKKLLLGYSLEEIYHERDWIKIEKEEGKIFEKWYKKLNENK